MPNSLLKGGSIEELQDGQGRCVKLKERMGGFIMSTGTSEMLGCKPELIRVWVDATREYGTY